jgi:hypothetical protein
MHEDRRALARFGGDVLVGIGAIDALEFVPVLNPFRLPLKMIGSAPSPLWRTICGCRERLRALRLTAFVEK